MMTPSFVGVDMDNSLSIGYDFKPAYLFNGMLVHLVDDIVWCMSFRNTEYAGKVLCSIFINVIGLIFIVLGLHWHC